MPTASQEAPSAKDEADIRALIAAVGKAHHDKDAAGIVAAYAAYAADAVVFNLAPPLSHRGLAVREMKAWLDTWEGPVEREAHDFHITLKGDVAFCHGFYRLSATPKAGGQRTSFWMRATVCLHRAGDTWRIVHEHTSVPFYMDGSFRAALDLEP